MLNEFFYICFYLFLWIIIPGVVLNFSIYDILGEYISILTSLLYLIYVIIINYPNLSPRFASKFPITKSIRCKNNIIINNTKIIILIIIIELISILPSTIINREMFYLIWSLIPFLIGLYLDSKKQFKTISILLCFITGKYVLK